MLSFISVKFTTITLAKFISAFVTIVIVSGIHHEVAYAVVAAERTAIETDRTRGDARRIYGIATVHGR